MDLERQQWSEECLRVFGISRSALPRIASNAEVYGHMVGGPLAGTPICGCLGDQQAALLGAALLSLPLCTRLFLAALAMPTLPCRHVLAPEYCTQISPGDHNAEPACVHDYVVSRATVAQKSSCCAW